MTIAPDSAAPTIAGHTFALQDRAEGLLHLRVALEGQPLVALARALARLDGVRVTGGPEGAGRERGYLVHCPGFKMVLSSPAGGQADFALALVSRTPQAALAVMSDLGEMLGRLMSGPPRSVEPPAPVGTGSGLRPSTMPTLRQGQPLARKTGLRRKTPLARGPFRRR